MRFHPSLSLSTMSIPLLFLLFMLSLLFHLVCGQYHVISCIPRERDALLQFKAALWDPSGMLSSWTTPDCCQWDGIRCSNLTSHILRLDLHADVDEFNPERYMHGEIPKSLMELQQLNYLNLSSNSFRGTQIPDFLASLTNLRSLDLSSCEFGGNIPSQFGSLSHLNYLNLRWNLLEGSIPPQLGNLSNLQYLDLRGNYDMEGSIPPQLGNLSNLQYLDLSDNSFEGNIPSQLGNLSKLQYLDLNKNSFEGNIPCQLGDLSKLQYLDLNKNSFEGNIPPQLGDLSKLQYLDLSENSFEGNIPSQLGNFSKILHLDLSSNAFEGNIPSQLGKACALRYLNMSNNSLSEEFSIHHLSGCARYSLEQLDLGMNQIYGTLPDLSIFSSLKVLYLYGNKLSGEILKDIQFPPQLEVLDMQSSSLKGVLTDYHFANISKLSYLELSDNSLLALTFTQNWVPPFRLSYIGLRSCMLGPAFPRWLRTQNNFHVLDISNATITDMVPKWFWAKSALQKWVSMNISYNNLYGIIPNFPLNNPYLSVDLGSNQFEGPIPPFLRGSILLDLSNNKFNDSLSFLCASGTIETLYQLDLSNNQLSGQIPDCWSHFKSLSYLDLSHNNFSEKIPTSMGSLLDLQTLVLRNNSLTNEIPLSLRSCTKLVMLDMAENRLSGPIPTWIGSELQDLQFLSLGRNHFYGSLPFEICYIRSIQLLDLSLNNLSGQIPKCIKNFTSMAQKELFSSYYQGHSYVVSAGPYFFLHSYDLNAFLMWKGSEQKFKNRGLSLLESIDLSSNHFAGEIPIEMENLFELVSLNLSRNNLTGDIPSKIGRLTSLEFLDLSRNQFVGSIPLSLTQIDRLTMLDLSHNHLTGEIPTSTQLQSFNTSSYEDNLDLCGPPLQRMCIHEEPTQEQVVKLHDDELLFNREFYISMTIGFVISFWGVFGSILFKRSWRHAYFKFLSNLSDTIYVMAMVKVFKWWHST